MTLINKFEGATLLTDALSKLWGAAEGSYLIIQS